MGFYQFQRVQKVNASIDQVWEFISSPKNLKEITPDAMGFDIITEDLSPVMYAGMIISYFVKPFWGIKMKWVTEITHIRDKEYFVDEQRVGPYKIWHHQHILEPIENGVLMKDIISYQPPFGILGNIANQWMIKNKLKDIFNYRFQAIEKEVWSLYKLKNYVAQTYRFFNSKFCRLRLGYPFIW